MAFKNENIKGKLFPIVGFHPCGIRVRANFGMDEFKFDGKAKVQD